MLLDRSEGGVKMIRMKVIDNVKTCQNIKRYMDELSIKPQQIRQRLYLESVQSVYKWLDTAKGTSNKKTIPSLDNLVNLADVFGCSIDELLSCYEVSVDSEGVAA